jgi:peroxiredoxin
VHAELARRGGGVVALCVDSVERNRAVVGERALPFPIVADVERRVVRAYGLVHERGGPGGGDVALPAQLLIDRGGTVRWAHVARAITDRPDPAKLLERVRALPSH